MKEPSIPSVLNDFLHLPHLSDGRIDYTHSSAAPILICFVFYTDKLLLLQRSQEVHAYRGLWSVVAGFIDDERQTLSEKVFEELIEELGVDSTLIQSLSFAEPYQYTDADLGKTWIRYPIRVYLKHEPAITLDWEHTEYRWVVPTELSLFQTAPGLAQSLERALAP